MDTRIAVMWGGIQVLYLWLARKRIDTACFVYTIAPYQLREAVRDLRRAGHGLERWIVPALEFNSAGGIQRRTNPDLYATIPEVLKSCGDLPVADRWKKIRANVLASAANAAAERANAEEPAADTPSDKDTKAGKRRKATASKAPGKRSLRLAQRPSKSNQ